MKRKDEYIEQEAIRLTVEALGNASLWSSQNDWQVWSDYYHATLLRLKENKLQS